MTDAVVILQARMSSRRLPGKALERIGRRSVLAHCIERLRRGPAPVLLATTDHPSDDVLAEEAIGLGVPVFRGAKDDVLKRFVDASRLAAVRFVVRATADNPIVDMDAPERVLSLIATSAADYVCERGLPYGAAVEAVSLDALCRAEREATSLYDREHVTTFIRRAPGYVLSEADAPAALRRPELRLTVDTAEDLHYVRRLSARLGHPLTEPALVEFIAAADALTEPVTA